MRQAVLYRKRAPTNVEATNTDELMRLTTILTLTIPLLVTPVVGLAVAVATAVIDEVGELVKVGVWVWV
jgi:hypothetical protein